MGNRKHYFHKQRHLGLKTNQVKNKSLRRLLGVFGVLVLTAAMICTLCILGLFIHNVSYKEIMTVISPGDNAAVVSVLNFSSGKLTQIIIPNNTQVIASRKLGSWTVGSLWQLGINENLGGRLMTETITRSFHFPINYWVEDGAIGTNGYNLRRLWFSDFNESETNLRFWDKLKLAGFMIRTYSKNRNVYDLSDYLNPVKLTDGTSGFLPFTTMPSVLIPVLAERQIAGGFMKMLVIDGTQNSLLAENIGKTIEVMGIKVVAVEKTDPGLLDDYDCLISGKDRYLTSKIGTIYRCQSASLKPTDNLDFKFVLSNKFGERY